MENVDGQVRTAQKMTQFRWKVALFIFLISFIAYMDRVNLSVATPVIMQEFGFNKVDMGFILALILISLRVRSLLHQAVKTLIYRL